MEEEEQKREQMGKEMSGEYKWIMHTISSRKGAKKGGGWRKIQPGNLMTCTRH